jgi:hypothetical protein
MDQAFVKFRIMYEDWKDRCIENGLKRIVPRISNSITTKVPRQILRTCAQF